MNSWYKESQVIISASVKVDAGTMRRARTTVGSSTNDLDNVCYYLNEYSAKIKGSEGLVKILNAIADSGVTLDIDNNGNITANVNQKSVENIEYLGPR